MTKLIIPLLPKAIVAAAPIEKGSMAVTCQHGTSAAALLARNGLKRMVRAGSAFRINIFAKFDV
jgi:hypothetical protein